MTTIDGSDKKTKVTIQSIPIEKIENNDGQIEGLPKNPRSITKNSFDKLVKSIQDDPEMLDLKELWVYPHGEKYVVIAGNMRLRALQQLKHKTAPCKIIPLGTPTDKLKRFAIKDNVSFGDNDWDMLANEWEKKELEEWGFRMGEWKDPNNLDDHYSKTIKSPVYEAKGEKPEIAELCEAGVVEKLLQDIEKADISDDEKEFLKRAAYRHYVFDYSKIANFYAHSSKEVQALMEVSALVIIDFDKAIENGFVELSKFISDIRDENE